MYQLHPLNDHNPSDERRAALAYVTEAFAEAILDGIEADCFAQAALFAALQELVESYGEDSVAGFAERLPERIRHGEFSVRQKQ
jgi:Mg/Co/Ni transporter MgtE